MKRISRSSLLVTTLWSVLASSLPMRGDTPSENETPRAHLLRGQAYLDKGQNRDALSEFNQVLAFHPTDAQARLHLAMAQWNLGRFAEAAQSFGQVLEQLPQDAQPAYYLGLFYEQNNHLTKAAHYLERVIRVRGGRPLLDEYFRLGKIYLSQGEVERAVVLLEQGARLRLRDDRIYTQLGKAYARLGRKADAEKAAARSQELRDYQRQATALLLQCSEHLKAHEIDQAIAIYQRLIETEDVDDLVSLGINFGQNELYHQAAELLKKAARLAPDSFEAHYNLGLMFLRMQNDEAAQQYLSRAVELRPYSFEANSLLGVLLSQSGKNEQTILTLLTAEQLKPGDPKIATLLGVQLIQGRYYAKAISTLQRAVAAHPENLDLRFLLVQAHYQHHDFETALREAEQILQRAPDLARAHFEVGFQLKNFGRLKESEPYFLKAIALKPNYAEAQLALGELLLGEEKAEESLASFRKATEGAPDLIDAYLGAGKALLALQKYAEAIDVLERAQKIDPEHPQPHLHLSRVYSAIGDKEKASRESDKFKALNNQRMARRDAEVEREFQY
jgi:tetratricopeptide (TPR) repeat protein